MHRRLLVVRLNDLLENARSPVQRRLRKHHSELCCGGKRCTFWNRDSVFINNGQMPDYFYYWCATSRRGNTMSRTKKWPIQKPGINGAIVITYTSALIFQEVCFMYIRFEIRDIHLHKVHWHSSPCDTIPQIGPSMFRIYAQARWGI